MDKIKALEVFVMVVRYQQFALAAEQLDLSTPMVSRYIATLEQSIGTRLLHRTTRHLSLTEAGEDYFHRAVRILEAIQEADSVAATSGMEVSGTLRITAPVSLGQDQLVHFIVDFQKKYPALTVELHLDDKRVNLVQEGYDLALRIGQTLESGVIAKRLCPFRSVLCASPDYLKRVGIPKTLQALAQQECLTFSPFLRQFWRFERDGESEEIEVTSKLQINNLDALVRAAIAGRGFVYIPTLLAAAPVHAKQLQVVEIQHYQPLSLFLYVVYSSREFLPIKVRTFINALTAWLSPEAPWDK